MDIPRLDNILIPTLQLIVRRPDTENDDLVIQKTLPCHNFQLHGSDRARLLEALDNPQTDEDESADKGKSKKKKKSKNSEPIDSDDEDESDSDLLRLIEEEDSESEEDPDAPDTAALFLANFDIKTHAQYFREDWDYASRVVRDRTIGYYINDLIAGITSINKRGKATRSKGGIQNHQVKRAKCVRDPLKMINFEYDRFYPISGARLRKKDRTATRVIPIHLLPPFLAAQLPRIHDLNATLPICYNIIMRMEKIRDNYDDDTVFICCLEQLKANTERIAKFVEARSDAIPTYSVMLDAIDRQLGTLQRMINEAERRTNIEDRLAALERQIDAPGDTEKASDSKQQLLTKLVKKHHVQIKQHHSALNKLGALDMVAEESDEDVIIAEEPETSAKPKKGRKRKRADSVEPQPSSKRGRRRSRPTPNDD